jgi:hypothetical protein
MLKPGYETRKPRPLRWRLAAPFVLFSCMILASSTPADSQEPMQFHVVLPCLGSSSSCASFVLADGVIGPNSGAQFRAFWQRIAAGRKSDLLRAVGFRSPGGDMAGGMDLGTAIRERGLETFVAAKYTEIRSLADPGVTYHDGMCASACVLAFAGGVNRIMRDEGRLGIHQFRATAFDIGESEAQRQVAIYGIYLQQMGVDRSLVDMASMVPPASVHWLTQAEAQATRLDNSGGGFVAWSLVASQANLATASIAIQIPGTQNYVRIFLSAPAGRPALTFAYEIPGGTQGQISRALDALSHADIGFVAGGTGIQNPQMEWALYPPNQPVVQGTFYLPDAFVGALMHAQSLNIRIDTDSHAYQDFNLDLALPVGDAAGVIAAALGQSLASRSQ